MLFWKKYVICLGALTCIGCSATKKINIDVLNPPQEQLSGPITSVSILNRVNASEANTKQFINGQVVAQFEGMTDLMVNEAILEMAQTFNSSYYVVAVDTVLKFIPKNVNFRDMYLTTEQLDQVCQSTGSDAVVTVAGYDAEVDTDSKVQYSTPVDRTYGTVQVPYFQGEQSVYMKMLFRTYLCTSTSGEADHESMLGTQLNMTASGGSMYELDSRMMNASNVMIQTARKLGKAYAQLIGPKWDTEVRKIYFSGSEQMDHAYRMAKGGNWQGASDIWYLLASSNNKKVAMRATFNLILANEIKGDYEEAIQIAQLCVEKYQLEEAQLYLLILKDRVEKVTEINRLFPYTH